MQLVLCPKIANITVLGKTNKSLDKPESSSLWHTGTIQRRSGASTSRAADGV